MDVNLVEMLGQGVVRIAGQWRSSTPRRRGVWTSGIGSLLEHFDPELLRALSLDLLMTTAPVAPSEVPLAVRPFVFDREAFLGLTEPTVSASNMLRLGLDAALTIDDACG